MNYYLNQEQKREDVLAYSLASICGFLLLVWGLSKLVETNTIKSASVDVRIVY